MKYYQATVHNTAPKDVYRGTRPRSCPNIKMESCWF